MEKSSIWKSMLVRGLIAVVLGVMVMVWPDTTVKIIVMLVGIWILIDGILLIANVFQAEAGWEKGLSGIVGLAALIVAFYCIFRPGVAAATVIWFIGIWILIRAVFGFFSAFGSDLAGSRWLAFLGVLIDLVLGILFITHPNSSATGLAWLFGLLILVGGVVAIAGAFATRGQEKSLTA